MKQMTRKELEIALAQSIKDNWGDGGVEYLVGALSSITTEEQLTVLLEINSK